MADNSVGYILQTNVASADKLELQQLVTLDAPTSGNVIHHCVGRQGIYFLSERLLYGAYTYFVHVLPVPGGSTDAKYETAAKQTYTWKSKRFVMSGRTSFTCAKVVHSKGCVNLKIFVDGKCRYDRPVRGCEPFRLSDQLEGIDFEIQLTGTATVHEVHIASTMRELASDRSS